MSKVYVYTDAHRMNVTHVEMHCRLTSVLDLSHGGWSSRERVEGGKSGYNQSDIRSVCSYYVKGQLD
jgi:hypothetical protein